MGWLGDTFGSIGSAAGKISGTVAGGIPGLVLGGKFGNAVEEKISPSKPQSYDSSGRPIAPEYQPAYDPNTMALSPEMAGWMQSHGQSVDQLQHEATRSGISPYTQMALQEQDRQMGMSRDSNRRTSAAAAATAQDNLAAHGGLSSGARERIQEGAVNDTMGLNQTAAAGRATNDAQLRMNDEQNRLQQLQTAGSLSLDQARIMGQANQFDIGNQIQENQARNAYGMDRYHEAGNIYGADKTAQAMPQGGGSSFICTALRARGMMSTRETVRMTQFMLKSIISCAHFFSWYFRHGAKAIEAAERQNFNFIMIKGRFVNEIIELIDRDLFEAAQATYMHRAGAFCVQFLGTKCGFKESMTKPSFIKGLFYLPKVLILPQTWKWAYGYYKAKQKKKVVSYAA